MTMFPNQVIIATSIIELGWYEIKMINKVNGPYWLQNLNMDIITAHA